MQLRAAHAKGGARRLPVLGTVPRVFARITPNRLPECSPGRGADPATVSTATDPRIHTELSNYRMFASSAHISSPVETTRT